MFRATQTSSISTVFLQISEAIVHEDYDPDTFYNDIALLKTKKPIDIWGSRGFVNGICLPTSDEEPEGWAIVTGWGHTEEGRYKNFSPFMSLSDLSPANSHRSVSFPRPI